MLDLTRAHVDAIGEVFTDKLLSLVDKWLYENLPSDSVISVMSNRGHLKALRTADKNKKVAKKHAVQGKESG